MTKSSRSLPKKEHRKSSGRSPAGGRFNLINFAGCPLSTLARTLFPFFRHTNTKCSLGRCHDARFLMLVPPFQLTGLLTPFVSLLFQNMVCEERPDVRQASLSAWKTSLSLLSSPGRMENVITQQLILDWFAVVMTPIGIPIDASTFYNPSTTIEGALPLERHNVDKNMLSPRSVFNHCGSHFQSQNCDSSSTGLSNGILASRGNYFSRRY